MSHVVSFIEFNGSETPGSDVGTTTTNINFGSTDESDITPADSKIQIGNRSYFKQGEFQFSGAFTSVSNAKFYKSAGDYKTEEAVEFSGSIGGGSTPNASDQGWPSIPTTEPNANIALPNLTTDSLPRDGEAESSPGYYSGSRTALCGLQLVTTSNTETGAVNQKTFSLVYDKQ